MATRIPSRYADRVEIQSYRATGQVRGLMFWSLEELDELLDNAEIMRGAAALAAELFHLGRSPHARHHDFNLSEAIQEALDTPNA